MLEYDKIDISEGIDRNKISASKECNICHYWYFLDKNYNYGPYPYHKCKRVSKNVLQIYIFFVLLLIFNG